MRMNQVEVEAPEIEALREAGTRPARLPRLLGDLARLLLGDVDRCPGGDLGRGAGCRLSVVIGPSRSLDPLLASMRSGRPRTGSAAESTPSDGMLHDVDRNRIAALRSLTSCV